ncbi:MAG: hypothetical protein ACP5N6_15365 [Anaerolineae bacterium]
MITEKRVQAAMKMVLVVLGIAGLGTALAQCAGPASPVPGIPVETAIPTTIPVPTKTTLPAKTALPTPPPPMGPFHLTAATEVAAALPPNGYTIYGMDENTAVGILVEGERQMVAVFIDLTTGQVRELDRAENLSMTWQSISARWVTWYKEVYVGQGQYESELMVYDRLQDREFQLEDADPTWPGPVLSNDVVVWVEFRKTISSHQGDILARDLVTGQKWAVATGPNHQDYPRISGQWVIYLEFTEGALQEGCADLRTYYLTTGETLAIGQVPHPQNSSAGTYHAIAGHKVVWIGCQPDPVSQLHIFDLETRTSWPLVLSKPTSTPVTFGEDALRVGESIYSLEDGRLLATIDTSALKGDVMAVFVSGDRVLVWTFQGDVGGNICHLYRLQVTQ